MHNIQTVDKKQLLRSETLRQKRNISYRSLLFVSCECVLQVPLSLDFRIIQRNSIVRSLYHIAIKIMQQTMAYFNGLRTWNTSSALSLCKQTRITHYYLEIYRDLHDIKIIIDIKSVRYHLKNVSAIAQVLIIFGGCADMTTSLRYHIGKNHIVGRCIPQAALVLTNLEFRS